MRERPDGPGKVVWFSLTAAPAPVAPTLPVSIVARPAREPARTVVVAVDPATVPAVLPVPAPVAVRPG